MAIGVGSLVSPKLVDVNAPNVRGPVFGISETAFAGPYTILWNDGSHVTTVPGTSLDEITVADQAVLDGFVGRRVKVNTPASFNNWGTCVCVGAYKRSGASFLLLQNAAGEYFIEVQSANCTALEN